MNYEPRDIRQIKLVTGDELLTEVVGEDQIELLVRNPLRVHKERMILKGMPREANFFTRWMSFADNEEFIIDKRHVITDSIVNDAVADHYNRMMDNLEHEDEVTLAGSTSNEEDHSELLESLNIEDGDKPTFH